MPDRIIADADETELIDIPSPEEVLERLRDGTICRPEQAPRATQNFVAKRSRMALREPALRAAAAEVDAQLRDHVDRSAIAGPCPAAECIVALVGGGPDARDAIRVAKRRLTGRGRNGSPFPCRRWKAGTPPTATGPPPPRPTGCFQRQASVWSKGRS